MRFLHHAALLIAAVPLTLGQIYPIPDKNACEIGLYRCDNNALQHCVDNGIWETTLQCSPTAYCFAQNDGLGGGACHPLVDEDGQCSVINAHSCAENHLLVCDQRGYLDIVKHCSKTAYCFAQDGVGNGGDCHLLVEGDTQQCSEVNIHRCNDNKDAPGVQICGEDGRWKNVQACGNTELCQSGDAFKEGVGCAADLSKIQEKCKDHVRRCNGQTIQDCSPAGTWSNGRVCTSDEACVPNCRGESCSPSCINRSQLNQRSGDPFVGPPPSLEDPVCTPGKFVCDANHYGLWKCNDQHKWQIAKKCQTPGACIFDSPGRAHCEGPSMDPPSVKSARGDYDICKTGDLKCDKNFYSLWKCTDNEWKMTKKCAAPGDCKVDGPGKAHCDRGEIDPPALKLARNSYDVCKTGDFKCDEHFYSLWKCTDNEWKMAKKCAAPGDCKVDGPGKAHCDRGEIDPPSLKLAGIATDSCKIDDTKSSAHTCNTGNTKCDLNLYRLLKCNDKQEWVIDEKCTFSGDCKADSPCEAHCEHSGRDAFKLSRRASCTPGNLACDQNRRFLFECDSNGQWEAPLQCFGPGYCRASMGQSLMCAGFPQFDGQNPVCKSHCEAMDYLYCIGVSRLSVLRYEETNSEQEKWNDHAAIAKCKQGMCEKSDVSNSLSLDTCVN